MLGLVLAFVLVASADTASYVVLNHGRPAGEMLVITTGDTVIVKYHHVDRQRGPRSETRYRIKNGAVLSGETWQLPLYGPEPTPRPQPSDRFEIVRDSVLWQVRDSARSAPLTPGTYCRLRSQTAFDQALLTRYLLSRPDRTARLLPAGSARLEIVADTTVRTGTGRQRVRLAMIHGARGQPFGAWIDERGALVAVESGWFITVRRDRER